MGKYARPVSSYIQSFGPTDTRRRERCDVGHKREREAAKRDSETRGKDSKAVAQGGAVQGGTEASKGDQVGGSNARITTSAWR